MTVLWISRALELGDRIKLTGNGIATIDNNDDTNFPGFNLLDFLQLWPDG